MDEDGNIIQGKQIDMVVEGNDVFIVSFIYLPRMKVTYAKCLISLNAMVHFYHLMTALRHCHHLNAPGLFLGYFPASEEKKKREARKTRPT